MPADRPDPTDLRSQRQAAEEADKQRRANRNRELDDIRWLMSDKRGRRVMHKLLASGHIFHSSFTGNSETFFREGERNLALVFFNDVQEAAPERYAEMLKESKEHDDRNAGDRPR